MVYSTSKGRYRMPRDKSATHERLQPIVRHEFLEFGFEKASLKHIASQAGITAAGLYRHYPNKEEMFASLVEDTVRQFLEFWDMKAEQALHIPDEDDFLHNFAVFRNQANRELVEFMYNHYEDLKLVIMKSRGTRFEHFEDELINREYNAIIRLLSVLDEKGIPHNTPTDKEVHILSTTFIIGLTEAIKHDYTKEDALEHLDFVTRFLVPGFREILGF